MGERVKDLVCGMGIEKDTAEEAIEHMGETFYFCSASCRETFANAPKKYIERELGGDER